MLQSTDFAVVSKDFPERLTGDPNLLNSLPEISRRFKCQLAAATLGYLGVLAWDGNRFLLCPGFQIDVVDTTGAGDIFHGAFLYGLLQNWQFKEILEFSCAAAALNCRAPGARGNIAPLHVIDELRRLGQRSEQAFEANELLDAAAQARRSTQAAEAALPDGKQRGGLA